MSSATRIPRDRQTLLRIVPISFARAFLLFLCLAAPLITPLTAQTAQQNPAPAPSATPNSSPAQNPAPAQQKPAPVTTTVVVHGEIEDNYLPQAVTVGTLDGAPLRETPLSATVVTRDLLSDQDARLLSDVVKNDASVGDDYVPVGYYGDYQIRGFPLDLATGFEVNGMTIAGEQDVPLENKEQVEFLKGIAAVESGVASAGGLIDFVTKRPANIKAVDLTTDHRGTAYGAVDLGHLFGSRKQVGARVNLAGERIVPYMNDTNGWRAVGAGAADWKIDPATTLEGDFEYQHKTERDGSGYQLLGGTTLPDINQIYRSTMLGDQPWGPPDTYDTFNTGARLERTFSPNWVAFAAAGFSHSLIQDNVLYVYGCYYEAECNTGSAPYPFFFSPDGAYDIYDYRNPGELRIDAEAEAMITGHIHTGAVTHDITVGGELFRRSVQQPGFYTVQDPYDPSGVVQDGAVYTYIGSANIYQPIAALPPPGDPNSLEPTLESAGPRRLFLDSHQSSAVLQDRIHLPGRIAAHRRRPLRRAARPQLLRICKLLRFHHRWRLRSKTQKPIRLAAAIRHHLQSDRKPHPLFELRCDVVSRSAKPLLDRQRQPVSRTFLHAPGRGGCKVRARPAYSAHRCVLPHARSVLLSGKRWSGRLQLRLAGPRNPQWRRVQRRRQSRNLAAPKLFHRRHERHLDQHWHADLRQQAGDQRPAGAGESFRRRHRAARSRVTSHARLQLRIAQASPARRHRQRPQLQSLQPGSTLYARRRARSRHLSHLRR
jgi:hypothetical protein